MKFNATSLLGVFEIPSFTAHDDRGRFVKTFQGASFRAHGLETCFAEVYYTVSRRRVLRGLHFQLPPHDHTKLVHCASGRVIDVVVDLRVDSPTFGHHAEFELTGECPSTIYIPSGLAHGFYTLSDEALMIYKVTTAYAPEYDAGIRWDSANIPWTDLRPIVSERDRDLPALETFESPFRYASRESII
jgi:dTDP-4-dehydrorhamnose 3,5-epimerase